MRVASVAELKASLSEVLAGVKSGEEVVITERGRPVARIVACDPADGPLDDLVRAGLVRLARGCLDRRFWKLPRPADRRGRALAALIEDRQASR